MKSILTALLILFCVTAHAQRIKVHEHESLDSISLTSTSTEADFKRHLYNAGDNLQMSSGLDIVSITFAGLGVASMALSDNDKDGVYLGMACAGLSVLCEFMAIGIRRRAGIELKLAANSISITF